MILLGFTAAGSITRSVAEDFKAKAGIRSAMMFFRDYFGAATTVKIYKTLGSGCVDIAKKNPYRLCNEVEGVGFERADQMGMAMGMGGAKQNPAEKLRDRLIEKGFDAFIYESPIEKIKKQVGIDHSTRKM